MKTLLLALWVTIVPTMSNAADPIPIWPEKAPGETENRQGEPLPVRAGEVPPATRIKGITQPTLHAFPAKKGNGAAVVILPGGGYSYVVADKEGSEAAGFLHPLGVSVFVLHYRTKTGVKGEETWKRPLQDSQRAIRFLRANAKQWDLDPEKIGLMAFSAGGQAGAIHIGEIGDAYEKIDAVDEQSARPDFAMLVYPWRVADAKTGELIPQVKIGKSTPPTFLAHADEDGATPLSSVAIYTALKMAGISGELHIYQGGGHGYGVRPTKGSVVGTWTDRASEWLVRRGIGTAPVKKGLNRIQAERDLRVMSACLRSYKLAAGDFPTAKQGLKALVERPAEGPAPEPYRAYLKGEVLDPWGNPYRYRSPGRETKDGQPDVFSRGPDGKFGTRDDIGSWHLD